MWEDIRSLILQMAAGNRITDAVKIGEASDRILYDINF